MDTGLIDPEGGGLRQFTAGGGGGPKIYMVDVFGRSESLVPTPGYASDPAWGPLQD